MAVPPVPAGIPLAHAAFVNGAWVDTRTQTRSAAPNITQAPNGGGAVINDANGNPVLGGGVSAPTSAPAPAPVATAPAPAPIAQTPAPVPTPAPTAPAPGQSGGGGNAPLPSIDSDPELINAIAEANARKGRLKANFDAEGGSLRTRFARMLREAGVRLPQELQGSRESAASRGMLQSGGFLEEQGGINKRFADYNAQIGEDQTIALTDLLRNFTADNEDIDFSVNGARAAAARRMAERAAQQQAQTPVPTTEGTGGGNNGTPTTAAPATTTPVAASPSTTPVANPNIATPANPFPVSQQPTPAQAGLRIPSNPDGSPNNAGAYVQNPDGSRTPVNSTTGSNGAGGYAPTGASYTPASAQAGRAPNTGRALTSFDPRSQQVLKSGGVVVGGDGRKFKYVNGVAQYVGM